MAKVVAFTQPRRVELVAYEEEPLEPQQVRLRTMYSGISAGTELTAYRGSNPYLHKRWDAGRKLFVPSDTPELQYPVSGWGYEEVGEVVEVGDAVEGVEVGSVVYGTWGHRSHHTVTGTYAGARLLPQNLKPVLGIFSQIGAIALNGVHDARIRIGETVAVFGLGVPGQIVAQLATASGARVIGIDLFEQAARDCQSFGGYRRRLSSAKEGSVAEQIRELTDDRGADVAIEASGSTEALHEAIRTVAYSAKVVALGFYQGAAQGLFLGEEFHHNRVNVVVSQIFGVDPELTYRWNSFAPRAGVSCSFRPRGGSSLEGLITHTFPYGEAAEAFRLLDEEPEEALQVVLDFTQSLARKEAVETREQVPSRSLHVHSKTLWRIGMKRHLWSFTWYFRHDRRFSP